MKSEVSTSMFALLPPQFEALLVVSCLLFAFERKLSDPPICISREAKSCT